MSETLRSLLALARTRRCWGDEPSCELLDQITAEEQRLTPTKDVADALARLRTAWAVAAVSQRKQRNISFLSAVWSEVCELRRLKRQIAFLDELSRYFEVNLESRDEFQAVLIAVCGDQIDRKVRHKWVMCLRAIEQLNTPPDMGAAQILRLGGINRAGTIERIGKRKRRARQPASSR